MCIHVYTLSSSWQLLCLCVSTAQHETESESSESSPPLRPSSPPRQQLPPPKPPSMKQLRTKVIEELLTTEADYHSQMHVCCEKLIPAILQVSSRLCNQWLPRQREEGKIKASKNPIKESWQKRGGHPPLGETVCERASMDWCLFHGISDWRSQFWAAVWQPARGHMCVMWPAHRNERDLPGRRESGHGLCQVCPKITEQLCCVLPQSWQRLIPGWESVSLMLFV